VRHLFATMGLVALGCTNDSSGRPLDAASGCSIDLQDCPAGFVCPDYPQYPHQCLACGNLDMICCGRNLDLCNGDLTCVPSGGFEVAPDCEDCGKHGQLCCRPVVGGIDFCRAGLVCTIPRNGGGGICVLPSELDAGIDDGGSQDGPIAALP
jgi:hypothetical protein